MYGPTHNTVRESNIMGDIVRKESLRRCGPESLAPHDIEMIATSSFMVTWLVVLESVVAIKFGCPAGLGGRRRGRLYESDDGRKGR